MHRYYIIEGLFIILGLGLLAAIIKYPKDILLKLPLGIILVPFRRLGSIFALPFELLGSISSGSEVKDVSYTAESKLQIDFSEGDKYAFVLSTNWNLQRLIEDFLFALSTTYSIVDFVIRDNGDQKIIRFPKNITFYDFHLLIQYFNNELGENNSFGVYKSDKLEYKIFQDSKTLNNLLGVTSDNKRFSVDLLDDLEANQYLKLNKKLKFDTDWLEANDLGNLDSST